MTRTVTCLEKIGTIARRAHETDGRVVVITLTDHGRAVVLADRKRRDAWLAVQLTHLTADERAVLRRAAPILDRLSQAD